MANYHSLLSGHLQAMLNKTISDENQFAYLRIKVVKLEQQQQNFLKTRTVREGGALEKLRLYCVEVWKQVMLEV